MGKINDSMDTFFIANAASFRKLKVLEDESKIKLVSADNLSSKILFHTAFTVVFLLILFYWEKTSHHGIFSEPRMILIVLFAILLTILAPNLLFIVDHLKYRDFIIQYDKKSLLVQTKHCEDLGIENIESFTIYSMVLGKPNRQQVHVSYLDPRQERQGRGLVYASAFSLTSGNLHEAFVEFSRRIGKPLTVKRV